MSLVAFRRDPEVNGLFLSVTAWFVRRETEVTELSVRVSFDSELCVPLLVAEPTPAASLYDCCFIDAAALREETC